ncbi:hypothetical protein RHGRI_030935 [Rhododendron griersonianum]|uniref:Transposase MuDR plant domain-containing protein n=1 Tax=Rhododendron griersonianum TaxID=479676 RepID=A0AAV6I5Y4_9ERIC|nr:hypothetical protein RHGRI_030935 [Rhododendron griersonianum]
MTDEDKEPMFVRLAEEFDVDFSHPHVKAVTNYMLNGRYSDYHHELYHRIKKRVKKNTAKRSKVEVLHCCGSKCFVQRREELKESEIGRIEFYKETHCKKGFWTSEGAEKNYMEMMKLNNQPVPEGETPMTEDEICDKVLGRAIGYVRGLGYKVRPNTSTKVAHAMRAQLHECTKRADEADRRAEVAERRAEELTEEVISQRSTIDFLTEKTNRLESLYKKLASRMDMGSSPT